MKPTAIQELLAPLSHDERMELSQAIDYLQEKQGGGAAEGSLSAVIRGLSPAVRQTLELISDMLDTPRVAPFQPKMSEADYASALGLDEDSTLAVKSRLDAEQVQAKLQQRMPPDKPSNAPPTRRESVQAALEQFE